MGYLKFDPAKLEKLNDPARLESLPPDVLRRALGIPDDAQSIVEIGAGTGLFAAQFARRFPLAIVHAVDNESAMVDWMRENLAEVESGRIAPLLSEETAVPLPDEIADAVFMVNLHHELAEPATVYAEAFRLLKPGGRVLVADWAPIETPKGPPLEVRVSEKTVAAFLDKAGFTGIVAHGDLEWHTLLTGTKLDLASARAVSAQTSGKTALGLLDEARDAFGAAKGRIPIVMLERGTAEYVAAAFLARAASSLEGVSVLLHEGLVAEGLTIVRSLVEDVCSLSYILADADTHAAAWCDFEAERVAKYYDDLAQAMPSRQIKSAARDAQRSLGQDPRAMRSNWWSGRSPHAMAKQADTVYPGTLRFYLLLYAGLCDIAHFNAPALGMYVSTSRENSEADGDPGSDLVMAVQTTLAVALQLAQRMDDFLGLGLRATMLPLAEESSRLAATTMDDSLSKALLTWVVEQ